ncbi:hypothetical protein ANO11243_022170 [Dothideomycetidae sp. 11243]|nr:hypothetical protein ANO11243_022170 [fungal sp. No.11243]
MPKKRTVSYIKNSSYSHPSSGSSDPPSSPATVNERLQQLRQSNPSAELTQRLKDIAQGSSRHTVPPELRKLLGVPDTAPPPPKPGSRTRTRLRTPGPAPPPSWLSSGLGRGQTADIAGEASQNSTRCSQSQSHVVRCRPEPLADFASDIGQSSIDPRSLAHAALRTIADSWADLDDDGIVYLAGFPARLRAALIAYVGRHDLGRGISTHQLEILVGAEDSVSCLDLTGMVGWDVKIRNLTSLIGTRKRRSIVTDSTSSEPADSWEDEAITSMNQLSLSRPLRQPPVITALSLAQPAPGMHWTDLLNLTAQVPTLTHLSLADWPWPTKTPHLAGASYSSPDGRSIPASGSSYYAEYDGDISEARLLLDRLSRNTYCLRHLDISRCRWAAALVPSDPQVSYSTSRLGERNDWSTPSSSRQTTGPCWGGAWKLVSRLCLAQATPPHKLGWVPSSRPSTESLRTAALRWLHMTYRMDPPQDDAAEWRDPERDWSCRACGSVLGTGSNCRGCLAAAANAEAKVADWLEREQALHAVAAGVRWARRKGKVLGVLDVRFGWGEAWCL